MKDLFDTPCIVVIRFFVISALSLACVFFATQSRADNTHLRHVMTSDDVRHLLSRTGIGASVSDIAEHQGLTREQGVQLIVQGIRKEPDIPMPAWVENPAPHYHARVEMSDEDRRAFNNHRDTELAQLKQWWVLNMLQTSSPQTERLVLFWHDLFATNARDIGKHPLKMARQNQRFRQLGFGSWETLLKAMIRDAALLAFLDAGANHKTAPNENLARELMELFVLGEGHYDEISVKNAARALTGHSIALMHNLEFQRNSGAQDRDEKQLFDRSGTFDGDDLIEILLQQDAASEYLASRFWYAFVADSKPPEYWLEDQGVRFRNSGFDIAVLYRNVLQSAEFWDEQHRGAIIKSPVDLVVGTARTLDYPMRHWQQMPDWQATIGMHLFEPPNVAGWKEGAAFVTPGHLLNRYNIVNQMTSGSVASATSDTGMMDNTSQMAQNNPSEAEQPADAGMQMFSRSDDPELNMTGPVESDEKSSRVSTQVSQGRQQAVPEPFIAASAVHMHRAAVNGQNDVRRLDILLDHVDTREKQFDTVRFFIEKKPGSPLMMKLGSYSCWPDCIDPWPKECGWTDPHFPTRRTLSFPWVEKDNERWVSSAAYQCQFDSLRVSEKTLIATLWTKLPELLASIMQTKRFAENKEQWLPVVQFIQSEYTHPSIEPDNTPYSMFSTAIKVGKDYALATPDVQPFSPPITAVSGIEPFIAALSTRELLLHQILLPDLGQGLAFESAQRELPSMDNTSVHDEDYLQAVVNHPLFQLK